MARALGPTIELAASDRLMRQLEQELANAGSAVRKGAVRALRRSLAAGKTAASREIRDVINLKKKPVDARIEARVLSQRGLVGRVAVRDRRVPLVEFLTRAQIATAYRRQRARRSRGVPVKVYRRRARRVYPDTFLAIGTRSGRWHVLKRVGRAQYPIRIQYGPNLTADFEKNLGAFAARAAAVLEKNLEREIAFALGRV